MRKPILFVMCVLSLFTLASPTLGDDLVDRLMVTSATVVTGHGQGSCTLTKLGDDTFIFTAAHVISSLRKEREVVDGKTGTKKTVVDFGEPEIVQERIEKGRKVGELRFRAEVLRYSNADSGHDLALLRSKMKGVCQHTLKFYDDDLPPPIGSEVVDVGSMLGQVGANSFARGYLSQVGRIPWEGAPVFDQVDMTTLPGMSGSGVYLRDGRYVGMVVRGAGERFGLIVPVRRMKEWAKQSNVMWSMDAKQRVPHDEDLQNLPKEDNFTAGSPPPGGRSTMSFPFLLNYVGSR